jgi:hypothetical protein
MFEAGPRGICVDFLDDAPDHRQAAAIDRIVRSHETSLPLSTILEKT